MGRDQRGTGNKNTAWLQEVKIAIHEQVPPLSDDEWALVVAKAVKFLSKKRNGSAPGPDKITIFWWKRAGTLYKVCSKASKKFLRAAKNTPNGFLNGKPPSFRKKASS